MLAPEIQYGFDEYGLIWGYIFSPEARARAVDCPAALEWIAARKVDSDEFLWLHFSLSNASCLTWMHSNLDLPDTYYESLHESIGSTRLEQDDNALVSVIHDVRYRQVV